MYVNNKLYNKYILNLDLSFSIVLGLVFRGRSS